MAFRKAENIMKSNKIILSGLAIIVTIGTFTFNMVGCSNDYSESKELEQVTLKKKEDRANGEVVFRSVGYDESDKEFVLKNLIEDFMGHLYFELGFDSQKQVAFFEIEKHLKEQKYVLKYDFCDTDVIVIGSALSGTAFRVVEQGKEQLELHCSGGSNDGKSIKVDKPTSKFSKATKEIYDFSMDCLNGGGCVEMCTASVAISSIAPVDNNDLIIE